jgi:hypothetical protein
MTISAEQPTTISVAWMNAQRNADLNRLEPNTKSQMQMIANNTLLQNCNVMKPKLYGNKYTTFKP